MTSQESPQTPDDGPRAEEPVGPGEGEMSPDGEADDLEQDDLEQEQQQHPEGRAQAEPASTETATEHPEPGR